MNKFNYDRLSCAFFFLAPSMAFGLFTSRLPEIRRLLNLDDSHIGVILLFLGCATLSGLIICSLVVDKFGSKNIIAIFTVALAISMTLASRASSYWEINFFCIFAGLSVGFCDVALNAQGISIEQHYNAFCLGSLHGYGSLGGVIGAITGSICAKFALSPFLNMGVVMLCYIILMPFAYGKMSDFRLKPDATSPKTSWRNLCFIVYVCGFLSLICHITEGSVGEWGSLLLNTVKGASQQEAALVFAAFTGAMVCTRLITDKIRNRLHDRFVLIAGSLLGALGMAIALLSPWPVLCLFGYAVMGLGTAPIVPILFSRAGATGCASPGQISSLVSIFSYAGLLLFPPFIGMISQKFGLVFALWVIVLLCLLMGLGTLILPRRIRGIQSRPG